MVMTFEKYIKESYEDKNPSKGIDKDEYIQELVWGALYAPNLKLLEGVDGWKLDTNLSEEYFVFTRDQPGSSWRITIKVSRVLEGPDDLILNTLNEISVTVSEEKRKKKDKVYTLQWKFKYSDLNFDDSEADEQTFDDIILENLKTTIEAGNSIGLLKPGITLMRPDITIMMQDSDKKIEVIGTYNTLVGKDFSNIELDGIPLSKYKNFDDYIKNNYLQGLDFSKANFSGNTIKGVDFSGSKFDYSNFKGCEISHVDFDSSSVLGRTSLDSADLSKCKIKTCSFRATEIKNADLSESQFENCDFRMAKLESCDLSGSKFFTCIQNQVKFVDCNLSNSEFDAASLLRWVERLFSDGKYDIKFKNCDFTGSNIFEIIDTERIKDLDTFFDGCTGLPEKFIRTAKAKDFGKKAFGI